LSDSNGWELLCRELSATAKLVDETVWAPPLSDSVGVDVEAGQMGSPRVCLPCGKLIVFFSHRNYTSSRGHAGPISTYSLPLTLFPSSQTCLYNIITMSRWISLRDGQLSYNLHRTIYLVLPLIECPSSPTFSDSALSGSRLDVSSSVSKRSTCSRVGSRPHGTWW
jgi:hypothetical protein